MTNFIKREPRFLEDTATIPTAFLSQKIRTYMIGDLGFIPENAYIGNAAGDYVFISVVKDDEVYVLTDCYNLDAELKDKSDDFYENLFKED